MNLFGVGGWELILVAILAILVFGPERMARHAFTVGRWMRKFSVIWQESVGTLRQQLSDEIGYDITQEDIEMLRSLRKLDIPQQLGLKDPAKTVLKSAGIYEAWSAPATERPAAGSASEEPAAATPAPAPNGDEGKVYSAWAPRPKAG